MRALLAAMLLVACAPRAMTMSPDHPADPNAPVGRSAGAPAALRPGVATLEDPAPAPTEGPPAGSDMPAGMDHSQHGSPPSGGAKPSKTDMPAGMDHSQHGSPPSGGAKPSKTDKADSIEKLPGEPRRVDPEKASPQKLSPGDDKTKTNKKPAPKPKKPTKQPAKPKEPAKPPQPPMPPMDHSGHGGG